MVSSHISSITFAILLKLIQGRLVPAEVSLSLYASQIKEKNSLCVLSILFIRGIVNYSP
jgi:hypothetical protein